MAGTSLLFTCAACTPPALLSALSVCRVGAHSQPARGPRSLPNAFSYSRAVLSFTSTGLVLAMKSVKASFGLGLAGSSSATESQRISCLLQAASVAAGLRALNWERESRLLLTMGSLTILLELLTYLVLVKNKQYYRQAPTLHAALTGCDCSLCKSICQPPNSAESDPLGKIALSRLQDFRAGWLLNRMSLCERISC